MHLKFGRKTAIECYGRALGEANVEGLDIEAAVGWEPVMPWAASVIP
jgi:hypothetical protein